MGSETQLAVKERPIIFTGECVRAILEGRKTQTRPVIKPQPASCEKLCRDPGSPSGYSWFTESGAHDDVPLRCPYGHPGDRLWVRETWRPYGWRDGNPISIQYLDLSVREESGSDGPDYESWYERLAIQATDECSKAGCRDDEDGMFTWDKPEECPTKWRPSIHMPRWALRLTLEILKVRVERVQEISEADALAEGIPDLRTNPEAYGKPHPASPNYPAIHIGAYVVLWNSINAKRGFGWDVNPWVWVIEFRKI